MHSQGERTTVVLKGEVTATDVGERGGGGGGLRNRIAIYFKNHRVIRCCFAM